MFANPAQWIPGFFALATTTLLTSCASLEEMRMSSEERAEARRVAGLKAAEAERHALFRGMPNWKKNTFRSEALIEMANPENTAIEISLPDQRGVLLVDGAVALDFPVATGKRSHPTPAGSYTILDKKMAYASNLYGKIHDAEGNVVNSDADTRVDTVPEGGKFFGASMPYWMRMTNSGVGMHVGYVPGRPASHGCIRLRPETAKTLFALTRIGTPVVVSPDSRQVAKEAC